MSDGVKILAQNRKAKHNFFIEETYEAGIELKGTEVKSIRAGKVNLGEGFASIDNGEVFLKQVHVSPYEQGNIFNVDPLRTRKLLLHKHEIRKLIGAVKEKGYSLIPLSMYLKRGKVKVSIALAKGKKLYDKRETIAKRDAQRRIQRELTGKY
ncbi:SsrA-binding protein [Alkalithermobacter thermoalcaliphilus JW-YL-7 = DSM 7308]|uniref:SsrA-binding protein n=1 Tax=Alkalithermobacter thermoalcaliphilus JW-YL-7 = DSM 7308 TaxID=1121328 RepID=A0A150FRP4_CLOPD|nr:SsrA-binding protein [[Clostridium] paradoxum JW-YL-7 = DSM 7308]SHK41100.1 SsrA-binding protein [[Clostridium] paradoxum JW-YL-7 = DSM 7308]